MNKGFVFSIEATISLICLIIVISSIQIEKEINFNELLLNQQENDLLRVYSNPNYNKINDLDFINDSKKLLGEKVNLYINDIKIYGENIGKINCVSNETTIIENYTLEEKKIKIIVCE